MNCCESHSLQSVPEWAFWVCVATGCCQLADCLEELSKSERMSMPPAQLAHFEEKGPCRQAHCSRRQCAHRVAARSGEPPTALDTDRTTSDINLVFHRVLERWEKWVCTPAAQHMLPPHTLQLPQ